MTKTSAIIKNNIDTYAKYGYSPGGFCEAVLLGKLDEALQRADTACKRVISDIVKYVNDTVPPEARGSEEAIRNWPAVLRKRAKDPRND